MSGLKKKYLVVTVFGALVLVSLVFLSIVFGDLWCLHVSSKLRQSAKEPEEDIPLFILLQVVLLTNLHIQPSLLHIVYPYPLLNVRMTPRKNLQHPNHHKMIETFVPLTEIIQNSSSIAGT
jgi:hypothetical protein